MNNQSKYFAYIRKSSDREDAQILSIDAQKRELRNYARNNNLKIIKTFEESASAYKTGRKGFNEMLKEIERGKANGILVYHLTRIARNSLDGGNIIYMMDEGLIKEIRTPERLYTSNGDDKFIMQIHFAMAKKSSDDTSQFVKRDIKSKILKGEYPVSAPIGYLNMSKFGVITGLRYDQNKQGLIKEKAKEEKRGIRRIEQDPLLAPLIRKIYQDYNTRNYSIDELRKISFEDGLTGARSNSMVSKATMKGILSNPIYYGAILWKNKIYPPEKFPTETKHSPIVTKDLFESVQEVLGNKSRPRKQVHHHKYTGLIRCSECGSAITAEIQKGKTYYRCSKKKKMDFKCSQPYLRENTFEEQMERELNKYVLPKDFIDWALESLNQNNEEEQTQVKTILSQQRKQLTAVESQLSQLLKLKISPSNSNNELLNDEEYLLQKKELVAEKQIYQEKVLNVEQLSENWLEQCEEFFDFALNCEKNWEKDQEGDRKKILSIMFGSNLYLDNKKVFIKAKKPFFRKALLDNPSNWRGRPDLNRRPPA